MLSSRRQVLLNAIFNGPGSVESVACRKESDGQVIAGSQEIYTWIWASDRKISIQR